MRSLLQFLCKIPGWRGTVDDTIKLVERNVGYSQQRVYDWLSTEMIPCDAQRPENSKRSMMLTFHPDKQHGRGPEWMAVCNSVSKMINRLWY